jgi:predicted transcriptional regulator
MHCTPLPTYKKKGWKTSARNVTVPKRILARILLHSVSLEAKTILTDGRKAVEIQKWMSQTQARDIMTRNVVTFRNSDPLTLAAATLLSEQVSGAPVVDESGKCVGILSASDLLGAEEKVAKERQKVAESAFWTSNLALPMSIYASKLEEVRDKIAPAWEQPVERFMTSNLVSVEEDTTAGTIVKDIVDAHVHRVLVTDTNGRLQGIVSTTDILAALMRAS